MTNYRTPGVYVEEIPSGPKPIEALGASTAGILGVAPKADAFVNEAKAVNGWLEFCKHYVGDDDTSTPLSQAVLGFFQNGGGRCYVVNVGRDNSIVGGGRKRQGVALFEELDEPGIICAPGYTDPASYDALLGHCEKMGERFAILDAPDVGDIDALTRVAEASAPKPRAEEKPEGAGKKEPAARRGYRARFSKQGYGAYYFPWLSAPDCLDARKIVTTPPSGYLAGLYARTDGTRGIHKAPANAPLAGCTGLSYRVTHEEQGQLNQNSVNCLRFFEREGLVVWGARTLAGSSSEWRYVPVRRLCSMIAESLRRGTSWCVFEPNNAPLWKRLTRDISDFLRVLWRQGALMGATPEEAFFVKCDAETNPPDEVNAGRVIALIGVAPVKPAEFVILRLSQSVERPEGDNEGQEA